MTNTIGQKIDSLIPKSIDDIIRKNRDQGRLYLTTPEKIKGLTRAIVDVKNSVRDTINDWRLITIDVKGYGTKTMLLGDAVRYGGPWITSNVLAVDLGTGIVVTANSTYRLGSIGEGEPPEDHLILVCAFLSQTCGEHFGVPAFFY